MDTILKPRSFSKSESDSSSEEEKDENANDRYSTSSSKVTVVPKEGVDDLYLTDSLEKLSLGQEETDSDKKIICPTARFLQVNPKKISSYDLLVRPPKRSRFIVHPSRESMDRSGSGGKGMPFTRKTNPFPSQSTPNESGTGSRTKTPVMECIFFENEKLTKPKTSSRSWSTSASASPRITSAVLDQLQSKKPFRQKDNRKPVPLPRLLSEENTIREIETVQETLKRCGGAPVDIESPTPTNTSYRPSEDKLFPATENYTAYAQWSPSFRTICEEYEQEMKQKITVDDDENQNFLPNESPLDMPSRQSQEESVATTTEEPWMSNRKILKPAYRFKNSNESSKVESPRPSQVYLKEKDSKIFAQEEHSLYKKDEKHRNKPPRKKRRYDLTDTDSDGDDMEEHITISEECSGCEVLFKMTVKPNRMAETGNVDAVSEEEERPAKGGETSENTSSSFQTVCGDRSSEHQDTTPPAKTRTRGDFNIIHHPDLRDFRTDSVTMEGMPAHDKHVVIVEEQEAEGDIDRETIHFEEDIEIEITQTTTFPDENDGNLEDPFQIYLDEDPCSGILFGPGRECLNLADELEESRIIDVTDLTDDEVASLMSEGRGADDKNMHTIFHGRVHATSTGVSEDCDDSCRFMKDFLKSNARSSVWEASSFENLDFQDLSSQEVLMQPKPHLNMSTSVYSTVERGGLDQTSTIDNFMQQQTKSDYFVGKVAGLSISEIERYSVNYDDKQEGEEIDRMNGNYDKDESNQQDTEQEPDVKAHLVHEEEVNSEEERKLEEVDLGANEEYDKAEEKTALQALHSTTEDIDQGASPILHKEIRESFPELHIGHEEVSSGTFSNTVENVYRRLSSGNRVRDNGDKVATPEARIKEVELLPSEAEEEPVLEEKSSSSSFMEPETCARPVSRNLHTPKIEVSRKISPPKVPAPKPILKKEKRESQIIRIVRYLLCCGVGGGWGLLRPKEKSSDSISPDKKGSDTDKNALPEVPLYILHQKRMIVHHTDSLELYKDRKKKFLKAQKKFYDESLVAYVNSALNLERQIHNNADNKPTGQNETVPTSIPINAFLDKSIGFNRDTASTEDTLNNNYSGRKRIDPNTVPVPVRLATSESALAGPGSQRQGRTSLVLQFPPFVQVLAAALATRRSLQDSNLSDLQRDKEKLRKPIKGILKYKEVARNNE